MTNKPSFLAQGKARSYLEFQVNAHYLCFFVKSFVSAWVHYKDPDIAKDNWVTRFFHERKGWKIIRVIYYTARKNTLKTAEPSGGSWICGNVFHI